MKNPYPKTRNEKHICKSSHGKFEANIIPSKYSLEKKMFEIPVSDIRTKNAARQWLNNNCFYYFGQLLCVYNNTIKIINMFSCSQVINR